MYCVILMKFNELLSIMFVITLKSTTYRKKNISKQISLGNQIVWQLQGQQKMIIAVGNKDEWASNEPLPEDSVIVGLIEETITNPNNAIDLWDVFLTNIYAQADEGTWHLVSTLFKRIPVQIAIADPQIANAVRNSLLKCKIKIKILENSF